MAREQKKLPGRINWRLTFAILAFGAAGVSTAVAGYKASLYVTSDPQFTLSHDRKDALTILGLVYASRSKVQRVFTADFDRSIFSVPLAERRRRLLAIDWVEDASVSRVWPDRLVIRIRERKPVAFVSFRSGPLLIDSQGVLLEQPVQAQFSFPVLSGVREGDTEADRRGRVRSFLQVQEEMGYLAKEVSEVDTSDPENVRIVSQVDRRAVTLLLGDGNYARRFQNFLSHYPEIRQRSPQAKVFDLRLDGRITVKE
ncbi:MAG: FtsQ-type POTRA domain-containing protein [Candidatus Solibacter sp.]|nr:FtsQ-type POTRA domain-containing protein [Candidatus Solibacter sp.]